MGKQNHNINAWKYIQFFWEVLLRNHRAFHWVYDKLNTKFKELKINKSKSQVCLKLVVEDCVQNMLNYIKTLINYDYILRKAFCLFCHIEIYQILGFPYVLLGPLESLWWVGMHKVISTCNARVTKFRLFSSLNFNQTKNLKSKKIAPNSLSKSHWWEKVIEFQVFSSIKNQLKSHPTILEGCLFVFSTLRSPKQHGLWFCSW